MQDLGAVNVADELFGMGKLWTCDVVAPDENKTSTSSLVGMYLSTPDALSL